MGSKVVVRNVCLVDRSVGGLIYLEEGVRIVVLVDLDVDLPGSIGSQGP